MEADTEREDIPAEPAPLLAQAPKRAPRGNGGPQPAGPTSAAAEAISQADDRSIYDWLSDIGTGAVIRVKLHRTWPKEWPGPDGQRHLTAGYIDEFDSMISENDIMHRYGGGKFTIKAYKQNPKGSFIYAGSKTFELRGDPKLTGDVYNVAAGGGPSHGEPRTLDSLDAPIQHRAMAAMERQATESQRRAWQLEDESRKSRNIGIDPELLRTLSDPMRDQVRSMEHRLGEMTKLLSDKDQRIIDLVTRKPDGPTFQDRILEKMVDGESARVEAIRVQHDAELRTIRENQSAELRQAREHMADELKQRERSHERELDTLRASHASAIDAIKSSNEARIDGLKGRISDLERQLTEAKTEVAELRARKEKGPVEAMQEVAQLKNAMEALGIGGGAEGEGGSIWERILGTALESPLAKAVAARVEQAPTASPPQAQRPPQRRVITPAQRAAARQAAQVAAQQGATREQQMVVAQAAAQEVAQAEQVVAKKAKKAKKAAAVDPAEVVAAVAFMEAAVRNNTDPVTFAESVRSMIPKPILDRIRAIGIDKFLAEHAKLEPSSPLTTQMGRNFIRKVARILIEGTAEEPPAEAVPVPVAVPEPQAATAEEIAEEMKIEG